MENPFQKGKKGYSILRWKCPSCHEGDLFTVKNPYLLKTCLDMPKRCPKCNQDFEIESGFYLGALWTSYPIVAFLVITLTAIFYLHYEMKILPFFILLSTILFTLQPLIMRYGRAIWINIFVHSKTHKKPPFN